ncbi:MAG TPA: hypothetical protein VK666_12010 [Chryseolinea sp.]|nr:hypothetical protein [Chryseolinea sp.]
MTLQIFRLLQLCVTIVLASQGIFYLLGLGEAVKALSVPAFAELRNAIDNAIAGRLRFLYYTAILLGVIVLALSFEQYHSLSFWCTAIAVLLTLSDILLAVKYNLPINKMFKSYPEDSIPWQNLQAEWIRFIIIRGVLITLALLSQLLIMIQPT